MRFVLDPLPPIRVDNATPGSPSSVVGTEPVWTDRSDASYLNAVGVYQGGVAITGSGTAGLPPAPGMPQQFPEQANFFVYARVKAPSGLSHASVQLSAPGGVVLVSATPSDPVPTVPTWVTFSLVTTPESSAKLLAAMAEGTAAVTAAAGGGVDAGSSIVTYAWQIYEVQVWVDAFGGIQPPLRQWPRTDGIGLSTARRIWPPPRGVQRSLRQGPGAYL